MTRKKWEQVKGVLDQALALAPLERSAFLDRACASDKSLRDEVESLLSASDGVRTSFLQSSPSAAAIRPGAKLGDYRVEKLIGAGGMGEVYRAHDERLQRDVAIKVLPSFVANNPDRLRRFEQEARAAAALNHPNILAVHQLGTYEGAPYLVSELLDGATLREQLKSSPLPPRKAIDHGTQIARGLAAAHEKGITHRDLKPENLFVTKDGRIKILDFGLAKLTQRQAGSEHSAPTIGSQTEPGMVMGSVGYMSPEQVRGQAVDHRTDIFAFGAILYEMLSGKRAFQRPTSADTMSAILNEDPTRISQLAPATPPALERVVHRCLEKNPEQRFQSASDLAFALEALSELGSVGGVVAEEKTRYRRIWIAILAGVLALVTVITAWWQHPSGIPLITAATQLTDDSQPKALNSRLLTDGLRVFFEEGQSGEWKITQVSTAGGQTAPVPTNLADPGLLDIEPGSTGLLLAQDADAQGDTPMWRLPLPAGDTRRVGNTAVSDAILLPDGTRLVYGAGTSIYVSDRDGAKPTKVVDLSSSPNWLSVSPDSRRIRFTLVGDDLSQTLWEVGVDGSGLRQLLKNWQNSPQQCCGRWTSDGRFYVLQSLHQGRWDLWALGDSSRFLPSKDAQPILLTNGPLSYVMPLPSSDGKRIYAIGAKDRGELVKYDLNVRQFVPVVNGISAEYTDFSRDGKWVVYVSYPDHALWRSRTDGSERLQLTYPPEVVIFPHISRDGQWIAFGTWAGRQGTYVISIHGGDRRKITDDGSVSEWSPDGNSLVVEQLIPGVRLGSNSNAGRRWEFRVYDLRTGQSVAVPESEGKLGPFWPAQNLLVSSVEDRKSLVAYSFKTHTWTDLAKGSFRNWFVSPDGSYVYFENIESSQSRVQRVRLADHRIEDITTLKSFRRAEDEYLGTWLGVAPDGSPVFTRDIGTQEIYALDVKWP